MSDTSYSATITADQPPKVVFDAVLDVWNWWSHGITGDTAKIGDVFHFSDAGITSSSFRLVEAEPGKRVVWDIEDAYLEFVDDHAEWTGTRVVFEISSDAGRSTVRFTHEGLTQTVECFSKCSRGWGLCMTSLEELIQKGPHTS